MKKLFTLSFMIFAMVASIKATVIWEGEKLVNWDADNLAIPAAKFATAQANDVLYITCQRAVADTWGGIEIGCGGSTVTVQQTIPNNDVCVLEWVLTAEQVAMFAEKGISVLGSGAIVTKVELEGAAGYGVIFEGSQAVSWDPDLVIGSGSFVVAKAGDKVIITAQRITPDAWGAVQVNSNWQENLAQQTLMSNDPEQLTWVLTEVQAANLKEYGGSVLGGNANVTKIELIEGEESGNDPNTEDPEDPNIDENTIWSGKAVCTSWNGALNLDGSYFEKVIAGDKIEFYITVNDPNAWSALEVDKGNYTKGALAEVVEMNAETTVLTYDINAEAAAELHEYGVNLTGCNYTLTRIQLVSSTTSAAFVSNANADNDAIYNLNGMRVNGKLPAGIYIKGGRKLIIK